MPVDVLCDLCGSGDHVVIYRSERQGRAVDNVMCDRCGLVFITPRPGASELRALYESGAFSLEARGAGSPDDDKVARSEAAARRRWERLLALGVQPADPLLEVGCGVGSFLAEAHRAGFEVTGVEPDPSYAIAGAERYGIPIATGLVEDHQERAARYGMIAAFHVLEHLESPSGFLARARREIRSDGLLYLEVPCLDEPYGGDLQRFFWLAHLYSFSSSTLRQLLYRAGFCVSASGSDGWFLWVVARPRSTEVECPEPATEDPRHRRRELRRAARRFRLRRALADTSRHLGARRGVVPRVRR